MMDEYRPLLAITMGDPAGIGPEIVLKALADPATYALFRPDLGDPSAEDVADAFGTLNPMGVPWLQPSDMADAALFLASEEARYITGVSLDVAGGWNAFHAA